MLVVALRLIAAATTLEPPSRMRRACVATHPSAATSPSAKKLQAAFHRVSYAARCLLDRSFSA